MGGGGGGYDTWGMESCVVRTADGAEFGFGDELERLMNEQKKFTDKLLHYAPLLMVAFVALLVVHDVFGTHGYLAMRQKRREIQKVRRDLEKLNQENTQLQQNVQDLKSDPETIRKIAREEYGLANPHEIIIKLPAPKPVESPAVKP